MPNYNQFSGSSMAASMGGSSNAAYNPYNLSNSSNNLFSGSGMASSMGGSASGGVGAWGGVADWSQPFQGSSNAATALNSASGTVAGATAGETGGTTTPPATPTLAETLAGQISTDYGSINLTPDQQTYAATLTDPQRTLFENVAGWTGLESGTPGANPSMTQPNMPSFAYGGTGLDYSTITSPYSAAHTAWLNDPAAQQVYSSQQQAAQEATRQAEERAAQQATWNTANPAQSALRNFQQAHAENESYGMGSFAYLGENMPGTDSGGIWYNSLNPVRHSGGSGYNLGIGGGGSATAGYDARLAQLQAAADAEIAAGASGSQTPPGVVPIGGRNEAAP